MSALVATSIEVTFGDRQVLRGLNLSVKEGERLGLVGPNGCGKSTLLKVISGQLQPDHGQLHISGVLGTLQQQPMLPGTTVGEVMDAATGWHRELVAAWEKALEDGDFEKSGELQGRLDDVGWRVEHRVDAMLDRLRAPDRDAPVDKLSGGERRRAGLAAALLRAPDILLLDEPTNHLDEDTVEWLEGYLSGFRGTLLLITHDRYLLEAVAERIVEIEQGEAISYQGSYADYLIARAERHERIQQKRTRTLSMIAREAAWAARSPSARSTKQKARLQRLDDLRERVPTVEDRDYSLELKCGVPAGATLAECHGLTHGFAGRKLFDGVDLVLRPGDRIGILGPNGAGKSTLLKIITKQVVPQSGEILFGPRSRVGVLDQERTGLTDTDTVFEAAGKGNDHVMMGDQWIHVAGFLGRFAFSREMFDQPVSGLSGGERARLLLATRMLEGHTILLLDEPTNDLDLLTLRVLEEALLAYDGAAVIVTHDRAFIDRVCTQLVVLDGEGGTDRFADRTQLAAHRAKLKALAKAEEESKKAPVAEKAMPKKQPKTKLSFKEKRELEGMPKAIEDAETRQAEIEAILADGATYKDRADEVPGLNAELAEIAAKLETMFERWEELEGKA